MSSCATIALVSSQDQRYRQDVAEPGLQDRGPAVDREEAYASGRAADPGSDLAAATSDSPFPLGTGSCRPGAIRDSAEELGDALAKLCGIGRAIEVALIQQAVENRHVLVDSRNTVVQRHPGWGDAEGRKCLESRERTWQSKDRHSGPAWREGRGGGDQ